MARMPDQYSDSIPSIFRTNGVCPMHANESYERLKTTPSQQKSAGPRNILSTAVRKKSVHGSLSLRLYYDYVHTHTCGSLFPVGLPRCNALKE